MGEVIAFGEALIDFVGQPHMAGTPFRYEQYAGGAPANVAVAVARLGGRAAFVGMLSSDSFGDFLMAELRDSGVNVNYIVRAQQAKTAIAFVSLDSDGERSFSFYRLSTADTLFRGEHFSDACLEGAEFFHACSNTLTEPALAEATYHGMSRSRKAGAIVSFDVNLRPELWDKDVHPGSRIWRALGEAHVIKCSESEFGLIAEYAGGRSRALERLFYGGCRLVVVTMGASPIRYYTRGKVGQIKTVPVVAVDTTAAGDAFVGGLIYQLQRHGQARDALQHLETDSSWLESCLHFGAACGAIATTKRGSFRSMPVSHEVEAILGGEHA